MTMSKPEDNVHAMLSHEKMCESAQKLRDVYRYQTRPVTIQTRLQILLHGTMERTGVPQDVPPHPLLDYDPSIHHGYGQLGWCESAVF